jgi:hypothetical protein
MIFLLAKILHFSIVIFDRELQVVRTCDGRSCPHFVGSSESNGDKGLKKGLQKDKEVPVLSC